METVVLVHGLWMNGFEMRLLRRRLLSRGYSVYQFRYRTVGRNLHDNAERLNNYLNKYVEGDKVHLVAHSLGGLVVRCLLHDFPEQRPGRVVTLGSPHQGSYVAQRIDRNGLLRRLLGMSLPALLGEVPPWRGGRELGSLSGSLSMGLGWVFRGVPRPNDGTVAVAETRLEGMGDHLLLHASHFGLLFSRRSAFQVDYFLQHGEFYRD
ncbi:MAG: alpha/beta hydrolase [Pseudomonadota bacterium]